MWTDLLSAVALLLVIEGIIPFISPTAMRRAVMAMIEMNDQALRMTGFFSMVMGVILLYLIR